VKWVMPRGCGEKGEKMTREGFFLCVLLTFSGVAACSGMGFVADFLCWLLGVEKWQLLVGSTLGVVVTFLVGCVALGEDV